VLRVKGRTPTPFPSIVSFFGLKVESIKELEGQKMLLVIEFVNFDGLDNNFNIVCNVFKAFPFFHE
jgi:hypothetical protein